MRCASRSSLRSQPLADCKRSRAAAGGAAAGSGAIGTAAGSARGCCGLRRGLVRSGGAACRPPMRHRSPRPPGPRGPRPCPCPPPAARQTGRPGRRGRGSRRPWPCPSCCACCGRSARRGHLRAIKRGEGECRPQRSCDNAANGRQRLSYSARNDEIATQKLGGAATAGVRAHRSK